LLIGPSPGLHFADFFKPELFDKVISAVHLLTGKGDEIKIPSLALKMGYGLKKCAQILVGESLRQRDTTARENAQGFLQLMETEWSEKVSKHALQIMAEKKYNKPEDLPLTEDLVKLVIAIREEMEQLLRLERLDQNNFRRLSELTLARIILFNKRRTGEASSLTVKAYQDAKAAHLTIGTNSELHGSLSEIERHLSKTLLLIELRGKRGKKVPILLPTDVQLAIEMLLQNRKNANICEVNKYMFPVSNAKTCLRGWDVLRKLTIEFKCLKPESITGTKLRKYLSTTVQVSKESMFGVGIMHF
jgi:hypothetical protein